MSPNEFQLRQALRDGEGDRPDADRIIWQARQQRAERRRRITSIAAAAVVVGFLAGGTALLVRTGGGQESASSDGNNLASRPSAHAARSTPSAARNTASAAAPSAPVAGEGSSFGTNRASCPARFPELMLPGGGGTDQFGAGQPLFPQPVASVQVCVYSGGQLRANETGVVDGADATRLASLLENGTTSITASCPHVSAGQQRLALYATSRSGRAERVVTLDLACPYRATNGTAVRYLSADDLQTLRAPDRPTHPVGSPIK